MAGERLVRVQDEPKSVFDAPKGPWVTYFDDKDSYLQWVVEWKEVWKERSEEQKQLRIQLSQPHDTVDGVSWLQGKRAANKMYLRMLLHARRYAKKASWQMKQEQVVVS